MKFFKVYTETPIELTEVYVTKFFKKVKIRTYRTEFGATEYIKSDREPSDIANECVITAPQEIKDFIEGLGKGKYRKPEGRNREKWLKYAIACDLFFYDNRPSINFEGEMERTELKFYVNDLATKVRVEEMTAEEVLKKFSVTDCVEVVGSILGVSL